MSDLFETTVPVIMHKLGNLRHIVHKGATHAAENEIEESALTGFRLYPDMLPFYFQINIPTDIVCGCTSRLTGNDRPSLSDDAQTFDELIARIDATTEHLRAQASADYAGAETREVKLKTPNGELTFNGADYVTNFVFPNLYFHITTAYNILRHNGVKLGKMDYMRGSG